MDHLLLSMVTSVLLEVTAQVAPLSPSLAHLVRFSMSLAKQPSVIASSAPPVSTAEAPLSLGHLVLATLDTFAPAGPRRRTSLSRQMGRSPQVARAVLCPAAPVRITILEAKEPALTAPPDFSARISRK